MGKPITRSIASNTLQMTVDDTGFLLDRLGEDCHPLQFLRELTQNSIEAISRTADRQGEVIWDVDWNTFDLGGVQKLCVIDTGDGMTGQDMVKYINQLSSSISKQSIGGNYGVGAKVSAATRNHVGLIYLSWREGKGTMIHLWRDSKTGQYGLRQIERPDGSYGHFAEVEDDIKPEAIRDHGTMIVLLGNNPDDNTIEPPDAAAAPSRWVAKYLNTRYFEFPAGVKVRAREGWKHPRSDKDRNLLRSLVGQKTYLANHSESSGSVSLSEATAHWWILKDEDAMSQNSGYIESTGHIAALHNGELYEMASSRSGMARLQEFGVILGHRRVAIYVEPNSETLGRVSTTTARTNLLIDNQPLPWSDWAAEFRDSMPAEIEALIQAVAAGSSAADHSKSIRERLKNVIDLFKVSRYRPTPAGELELDDSRLTRGGQPRTRGESTGRGGGGGRQSSQGGTAGGVYSVFLKKGGPKGTDVNPDLFPEVRWISVGDGTREPGDIEDRAARYLNDQNLLLINADFRAFEDMSKRWAKEYKGNPAVIEIVRDAVHGWFEQSLVETVVGVKALENSKEWSVEEVQRAVSEEALTASVMPRYHVHNSVKRELGAKLGKVKAS